MNQKSRCPIWGTPASVESLFDRDIKMIDSPRAGGWYSITGTASSSLHTEGHYLQYPKDDARFRARLTSWLVDQRLSGVKCPEIDTIRLRIAKQKRGLSVYDRADRLLQYIENETSEIGRSISYTHSRIDNHAIAAWTESIEPHEIDFLLEHVSRQGWVKIDGISYTLTIAGYGQLAKLRKRVPESPKGFVAMWFHDSTQKAWEEGIRRGIEDAGYEAVRIDQKEHINKIDDEIIAEIRRSRFVVADFTQGENGARGGVYYEAGFAHGLGIEVIFTCRKDALGDVHFDTRQYNHIVWETPGELRQRLAARISAVIGDGPHKENSGN